MKPRVAGGRGKKWSQHVTRTSHALDLEANVFTLRSPRAVAVRPIARRSSGSAAQSCGNSISKMPPLGCITFKKKMARQVTTTSTRAMMATSRRSSMPRSPLAPPWEACTSSPRTPTGHSRGSSGTPSNGCISGSTRNRVPWLPPRGLDSRLCRSEDARAVLRVKARRSR